MNLLFELSNVSSGESFVSFSYLLFSLEGASLLTQLGADEEYVINYV